MISFVDCHGIRQTITKQPGIHWTYMRIVDPVPTLYPPYYEIVHTWYYSAATLVSSSPPPLRFTNMVFNPNIIYQNSGSLGCSLSSREISVVYDSSTLIGSTLSIGDTIQFNISSSFNNYVLNSNTICGMILDLDTNGPKMVYLQHNLIVVALVLMDSTQHQHKHQHKHQLHRLLL